MEKKKFDNGDKTSLTLTRQHQLESIGFRWAEPKGQAAWEKRFNELVAFEAKVSTLWRLYFFVGKYSNLLSWLLLSVCVARLGIAISLPKIRRILHLEDGLHPNEQIRRVVQLIRIMSVGCQPWGFAGIGTDVLSNRKKKFASNNNLMSNLLERDVTRSNPQIITMRKFELED